MILFISGIDNNSKRASKTALIYVVISIFCALFGLIYELYSHEVYSFYMIYAFAFPLVLGVLPFSVLGVIRVNKRISLFVHNLIHSGIATLTLGSIVKGVFDIYGTTNQLSNYYWYCGSILYLVGVVICALELICLGNKNKAEENNKFED